MGQRSDDAKRYADYKGRTYLLHWVGSTKFGRKAKLSFMDGSSEFWVKEELITQKERHEGHEQTLPTEDTLPPAPRDTMPSRKPGVETKTGYTCPDCHKAVSEMDGSICNETGLDH